MLHPSYAPSAAIEITPAVPSAGLGTSFAVGDADGDGSTDLWIGSPYDADGRVDLVFGPLRSRSTAMTDRTWRGTSDERVGMAVGVGDFDGDALDDTLVGAYLAGTTPIDPAPLPGGVLFLAYGSPR